jgi:hypothetical protein
MNAPAIGRQGYNPQLPEFWPKIERFELTENIQHNQTGSRHGSPPGSWWEPPTS